VIGRKISATEEFAMTDTSSMHSDARTIEALRTSEERFRVLFESGPIAVYSCDASGVIQEFNHRAAELWGREPKLGDTDERFCGSFKMIRPDGSVMAHAQCPMADVLCGKIPEAKDAEVLIQRPDGSQISVVVNIRPLKNQIGEVTGAINCFYDITERKRAERALLEADRQKTEFLATLAHELRNPLAPIRNSLNILSLTPHDDPATARVYEMMDRQVNHMARLVDDLLEISRITSGKIELRIEPVEIASVIRSAVETSRPLIDAGRHQLATILSPGPITVDGDLVRLAQIVANLLNNAAKYTEPGGQIWLTALRLEGEVVISVRDTGIGISPKLLPHVLEIFKQADRDAKRPQDGLGLGLAIVKRLIEMHGGSVAVKSEGEGRGSEFILRLPLSKRQLPDHTAAPVADRNQRFTSRQRILVVDDNRDAALSLTMLLKILGSDVETALDGQAALRVADTFRPTVVLMDLGMPGMSGYDVAKCMRALPQFENVTLIALTGWGQEQDRLRTREAGFDHHLVKPVNLDELQVILK
jgi:PAS domain S-box-containing protein